MTFSLRTFSFQFLFLATGVVTTIASQYLYYNGAAEPTAMLTVACNYYGSALVYFFPYQSTTSPILVEPAVIISSSTRQKLIILAFLDFFGSCCSILGIIYSGSGIFQVIYSSVVIFTAIWAKLFLPKSRRPLVTEHWYAIALVTLGLAFSALGSNKSSVNSGSIWIGICFTFAATMFFSFHYVLSEHILTASEVPAKKIQTLVSVYDCILVTLYLSLYTVPRFHDLVVVNVEKVGGSWSVILTMLVSILFSGMLHNFAYFKLMGSVGAVSTGILQSLRAVTVFVISAMLFCERHSVQCFNEYKGVSLVCVFIGVMYFSSISARVNKM